MKLKYILKPKNIGQHINKINVVFSAISLITFIFITYLVVTEQITTINKNLLIAIQDILPNWFIHIAKISYFLGEAEVAVFFVLFSLGILIWKKCWEEAQVLALSSLSVLILIDEILKPFFDIRRPKERLIRGITGYSYPSGHVAGNLLLYFLLAYIASIYFPKYKIYFYSLATFLILLMGISSAYLRIHWVSDILASYCLGYILFSLAILLLNSSVNNQDNKD